MSGECETSVSGDVSGVHMPVSLSFSFVQFDKLKGLVYYAMLTTSAVTLQGLATYPQHDN